MKIKIAISSTKGYADHTLRRLTDSLLYSGVCKRDILIVEGGYNKRFITKFNGIKHIKTNHNTFDWTALIDIVEYQIKSDFWFLIHDTCLVGPTFKKLLYNINTNDDKTSLNQQISRNIGTYKYEYLMKNKDFLMREKNTKYDNETLMRVKKRCIQREDALLRRNGEYSVYNPHINKTITLTNLPPLYNTSTPRLLEYFPQLDLYKSRANFKGELTIQGDAINKTMVKSDVILL